MTCKIAEIRVWKENLELTRPYTIATKTIAHVENIFVQVVLDNGITGWGACNPDYEVAGESPDQAFFHLTQLDKDRLIGRDIRHFQLLIDELSAIYHKFPGTLAALDIALHDAFSQFLGLPLAAWLGARKRSMPTSVTIGIMPVAETLELAEVHVRDGFSYLKVKLGSTPDEDLERLVRLREVYANSIHIRVDFNQAYDTQAVLLFHEKTKSLDIELYEQPTPPGQYAEWRTLPARVRKLVAADESLTDSYSAFQLLSPAPACGIFNIKLMKCGGVREALRIADLARRHRVSLMWGCNDESRISIAAALHAAFSCPHTKYIDLDGSFDLARDVVKGGFVVKDGMMRLTNRPGLGV
jgi:L-alanine-DL-glutamate epimerase-like enolase superfamily enzyme